MSTLDFSKPELLQTRDGREVRIYATDGSDDYPVHGAVRSSDGWNQETWTLEGRFNTMVGQSCADLVAKPQRVKGWVNMYRLTNGSPYIGHQVHDSQVTAKTMAEPNCQGQIYIDAEVQS